MPKRTRLERRRVPELKAAGWWDGESPPRGRQADKKMGVKKMNSGCIFFATHLFASPNSSVIQELGTSQRPHMMGGYKFQVPSSRFHVRLPVAGALLVVAFEAALLLVGFFCPVAGDFFPGPLATSKGTRNQ